jgi:hypothetical protein
LTSAFVDIVQRVVTHVATIEPANVEELKAAYLMDFHDIDDYDDALVINMDETPMTMAMPAKKTFARKGEKSIRAKKQKGQRVHFSAVLGITKSGHKLKPLFVFQGKFKFNNHIFRERGRDSGQGV